MKICRFIFKNKFYWGEWDEDFIRELIFDETSETLFTRGKDLYSLDDIEFQIPVVPKKIIGIGDNYPRTAKDQLIPSLFIKSPESLTKNQSSVSLPDLAQTWPEPEVGIVIKKQCGPKSKIDLTQLILGFIIINDVTCLSSQNPQNSHAHQAKNQPGFLPVGSFIQTNFHPFSAAIKSTLNGLPYRQGSMTKMKWNTEKILKEVLSQHTLQPMDMIICGCPPRVSNEKNYLKDGDIFVGEIQGLGTISTTFKSSQK